MSKGAPRKRVTLQDVADEVGVSAKTVSNVVNDQGWVSDPVKEKVVAAIDQLGYRPNLAARNLRSGRSDVLGLAVPTLREPYFAELAAAFVDAAAKRGKQVLVTQTGGKRDEERRAIEGESMPGLDGIVVSPLSLRESDLKARRGDLPLVLIGEYGEMLAGDHTDHVGIDNVAAAFAATRHLLQRGRKRIGVVGRQEDLTQATSRLRYQGYLEALAEAGIAEDPRLVGVVEDFNRREGSEAVARMLDAGANFDALFCFSDSLAFGALYSLAEQGLVVPEDVEVIGFDNVAEGQFSARAFHTVDPEPTEASRLILKLLQDQMDTHREGGRRERVPFSVVDRTHD